MKKKHCIAIVCGFLAVAMVATGIAVGIGQANETQKGNPSIKDPLAVPSTNTATEETADREDVTISIPERDTPKYEDETKLGFDITKIQPDRKPQVVGGGSESGTKEVENGN